MLTIERLKEVLWYCPDTGRFIWQETLSNRAEEGTVAGTYSIRNGVVISVDGHRYRGHWLAVFYMTGEWPTGEVDHQDGNAYNNSWSNLRVCSHAENMKNLRKRKDNPSGITGVGWYKATGRWRVRTPPEYYLGYFDDFFEACCARKKYELTRGFHENHGRR